MLSCKYKVLGSLFCCVHDPLSGSCNWYGYRRPSFLYKGGLSDSNLCQTGETRRVKKAHKGKPTKLIDSRIWRQGRQWNEWGNARRKRLQWRDPVTVKVHRAIWPVLWPNILIGHRDSLGYAVGGIKRKKEDEPARSRNTFRKYLQNVELNRISDQFKQSFYSTIVCLKLLKP